MLYVPSEDRFYASIRCQCGATVHAPASLDTSGIWTWKIVCPGLPEVRGGNGLPSIPARSCGTDHSGFKPITHLSATNAFPALCGSTSGGLADLRYYTIDASDCRTCRSLG